METNSVLEEINKFKQAVYDKLKEYFILYGTGWFDGDNYCLDRVSRRRGF